MDQAATPLSGKDEPTSEKVHVAVYYEALCPDSRSFVLKQLGPTYRKLSASVEVELVPYGKAKVRELVIKRDYAREKPSVVTIGRADRARRPREPPLKLRVRFPIQTVRTNDGYQFICQHGAIECHANMVHACSIDVIQDPSVRLQFVACMIENNIDPTEILNACAKRIPVDLDSIKKCTNADRGKELLAKYGEMTNSLVPRASFIPTITLDGVSARFAKPERIPYAELTETISFQSSEHQVRILKNLSKEVCLRFKVTPKECLS